jgi:hypothetical protein
VQLFGGFSEGMAAAGGDCPLDTKLLALKRKKEAVRSTVDKAMYDLEVQGKTVGVQIKVSRDGVAFMGVYNCNNFHATEDDWEKVLSEGLGATFTVDWQSTKYCWEDLAILGASTQNGMAQWRETLPSRQWTRQAPSSPWQWRCTLGWVPIRHSPL